MTKIFTAEERQAWDDVLFWAKRLTYKSADSHPEWRERYEEAKARKDKLIQEKRSRKQGK